MNKKSQNYINHIVLLLDASDSIRSRGFVKDLVKVADNQIAYLAQRSKELDQETRVTVYTFADWNEIHCLIYDKDVLRMPSISELYKTYTMTALMDATMLAINDLAMTPEKYGEHAFLIYVLTDGLENDSQKVDSGELAGQIDVLPENWTLATFVPDQRGVFEAKAHGFPKDNIAVWNTEESDGMEKVGERIRQTTENWMQNRAKGVRGTRSLFKLADPSVSKIAGELESLHPGQYRMLEVKETGRIDEFVEEKLHRPYRRGEAYYQLTKTETIQPQKELAIWHKHSLYIGDQARKLMGLPDHNIQVHPSKHDYEIYVQSTSNNRKLMGGTKLVILS